MEKLKRVPKPYRDLLDVARDVVKQYEQSIVGCGPDLADSIRVLLKQAIAKVEAL